jgi:hypothetical protein
MISLTLYSIAWLFFLGYLEASEQSDIFNRRRRK